MVNQPISPPNLEYLPVQQTAPNHALSQEDLSKKLLMEADKLAKKNPTLAIPLYESIVDNGYGFSKEQAIGKLLDIHKLLVERSALDARDEEKTISNALKFYDKIISNHPSSRHLATAYLYSGIQSWIVVSYGGTNGTDNPYIQAINRLEKAYENGIGDVKVEAAWNLSLVGIECTRVLTVGHLKCSSIARKYLRLIQKLVPSSQYAEDAKNLLGLLPK